MYYYPMILEQHNLKVTVELDYLSFTTVKIFWVLQKFSAFTFHVYLARKLFHQVSTNYVHRMSVFFSSHVR